MKPKYFLLLFVNLLFMKCVVFHKYNPKPTEVIFTDNARSSKSILVNIKQKLFYNGDTRDLYPESEKKLRKKFARTLKESLLFSEVKTGLDVAEINLRIEIEDKVEMDNFSSLSYVTFYFFPAYTTDNITLTFQFKNNKTMLIREYKRQIVQKTFIHLFLIPVIPFYFLSSDPYELVTKSVLFEADRDGVFR